MKNSAIRLALIAGTAGTFALAQPNRWPVDISNTLRVEYDDNVFTTGKGQPVDKQESFKFVNQLEFLLDTEQNATYYGVRYAPSIAWYEDRPGDSTDVNHQLDLTLSHRLSPISRLQLRNTLRAAQEPELVAEDVTVRRRNDFLYNSLNAAYETQVIPDQTTVRVDGRYVIMRYDDSAVADANDYDQYVVGLDVVQRIAPNTDGGLQVRYAVYDYEVDFRDVDSIQVGATLSRVFSPTLHADLRFGYEYRDADSAIEQTSDSPYIDGSLVLLPLHGTRVSVGAGFSKDQSPVNRFAQQERTRIYGSVSHELSPATTFYLTGSYAMGSFDQDDATSAFDPEVHTDGDENVVQFSARLSHQLNVRNSLEASYQYTELDSDIRPNEDFERNRISLGWKFKFQ